MWAMTALKLADKKCKILVVSKMDQKNQSGTDKAGGYEVNSLPSVNASTCANPCVHVHNIVIQDGGKTKTSRFMDEFKSFSSEIYSCFSGKEVKISRQIFKSSNLWAISAEHRQLLSL